MPLIRIRLSWKGLFRIQEELQLRINELAKKKKTIGLNPEEQEEQAKLYRIYIDEIKEQVKLSLENIKSQDPEKKN